MLAVLHKPSANLKFLNLAGSNVGRGKLLNLEGQHVYLPLFFGLVTVDGSGFPYKVAKMPVTFVIFVPLLLILGNTVDKKIMYSRIGQKEAVLLTVNRHKML